MKKIKYLLFIIFVMLIIPIVFAKEEPYITYENVKANDAIVTSIGYGDEYLHYSMSNALNYSFTIVGHNLDENKTYRFEFSSSFINEVDEYTGEELMDGVDISNNNGNGQVISILYDTSTEKIIKARYNDYKSSSAIFYFNENVDFDAMDEYVSTFMKDGKIKIDAVKPSKFDHYESVISSSLDKYNNGRYRIYGYYDEDNKIGYLNVNEVIKDNFYVGYKEYAVDYEFLEADQEIQNKINSYLGKFKESNEPEDFFTLDDLENINYQYMLIKYGDNIDMINSVVNYTSEIQKLLDYSNIRIKMDCRAGWGDQFTGGGFGFANFLYNGVIYGTREPIGIKNMNVVYVPNDTKDTREDYIKVALKRIKEYLKDAKVEITYAGQIEDIDTTDWIFTLDEILDVDKTLGEYYKITIDGEDLYYFIAKDSSKMKNPIMQTTDMDTDFKVESEDYNVPLDTKVKVAILNKDKKEYKDILKALGVNYGLSFSIDLFSDSADSYIKKLDNGKFEVYVPLSNEYKNKELVVYYINDDGTIEEHSVRKENGYAIFETDHFSTYTLTYADAPKNPATSDNIIKYITFTIISSTLLISSIVIKKTKKDY